MDGEWKIGDPGSITLTVTDPPTFSKIIHISDHCPIWLHVLVSGDTIVVSTQSSNGVPVGAGQDDL